MKSSVGDGKRRSGLFLERLCRVGELNTADTCQGFWGYNREAFRKKGCLLTNTDGYIWWRVCVCVSDYLWMHAYIMIVRSCEKWKMHFYVFYVSSTHEGLPTILWKILGTVPCWFSFRLGWMVCYSLRPLSALFVTPWSPMSWLPAIHSQSSGRTLCGFWPLWQSEDPALLPGSCLYHTVPFRQSASPRFGGEAKCPRSGSFHDITVLGWCEYKCCWRVLPVEEHANPLTRAKLSYEYLSWQERSISWLTGATQDHFQSQRSY